MPGYSRPLPVDPVMLTHTDMHHNTVPTVMVPGPALAVDLAGASDAEWDLAGASDAEWDQGGNKNHNIKKLTALGYIAQGHLYLEAF